MGDAGVADETVSDAEGGDADATSAADGPGDDEAAVDVDAPDGFIGDREGAVDEANDCAVGASGEPTELRCTGLYSDWASRTIAPGVRQYQPGFVLWSDGASKTRWIYLPPGQVIDTSDMDEWNFPIGTKVWKEFVLGGKRIETRLIWKVDASTWYPTTYRWSADESSTTELTSGELNADGNGYEVPVQQACFDCHQGRKDFVIGFEAVSLASPNAVGVTLDGLVSAGTLSVPPASPIVVPGNSTEAAALGYLHANCGTTCHNRDYGLARVTGLHFELDIAQLASVQATDTWTTAWNVPARFPALAGAPMRIAQCDTSSSGVYFRMTHRDGVNDAAIGTQMPPIDTHKVDVAGAAAIAAWIDQGCSDAGVEGGDGAADAPSEASHPEDGGGG